MFNRATKSALKRFAFGIGCGLLVTFLWFITGAASAHARSIIVCNKLGCHSTAQLHHRHSRHRSRHHHRRVAHSGVITCNRRGCSDRTHVTHAQGARTLSARRHVYDANDNSVVIGGRPRGCPHAYCGCGLARYLGLHDRRLNLADNWRRLFPRTSPHAGAVAVRRYHWHGHGHVMLLVRHVDGSVWLVREYNGGRHLSYLRRRSVRGYSFVQPGGQRFASIF